MRRRLDSSDTNVQAFRGSRGGDSVCGDRAVHLSSPCSSGRDSRWPGSPVASGWSLCGPSRRRSTHRSSDSPDRHLAWVTTTVCSRSSTRALLLLAKQRGVGIALRSLSEMKPSGVNYLTRLDTCPIAWTSIAQCSYAAGLIAGISTLKLCATPYVPTGMT